MTNSSALFRLIAEENIQQHTQDIQTKKKFLEETLNPYNICIIGADHPCVYGLFPELLSTKIFPNRDLCFRLITNDSSKLSSIQAIAMEIEDLACKQFYQIEVGLENEKQSYENIDLIIILDDFFYNEKEKYFDSLINEKNQLKKTYDEANLFDDERPAFVPEKMKYNLKQAFNYYQTLAKQIQPTIKSTCQILLACANSIMIATQAFSQIITNIPANNILGLSRIIENQAKARIGIKLHVDIKSKLCVRGVVPSSVHAPDLF